MHKICFYIFQGIIYAYRMIFSVSAGRQCRFEPTCSQFASDAFKQYHFLYAFYLILGRLYRCSPFSRYSDDWYFDPVKPNCCDNADTKKTKIPKLK